MRFFCVAVVAGSRAAGDTATAGISRGNHDTHAAATAYVAAGRYDFIGHCYLYNTKKYLIYFFLFYLFLLQKKIIGIILCTYYVLLFLKKT